MPICTKCHLDLDSTRFYVGSAGQIRPSCKECQRVGRVLRKQNHPGEDKAARKQKLKSLYGITPEQYDYLDFQQEGVCAICHRPPKDRRLHVDHDHLTGAIRGLLCGTCNSGLGCFRDSMDLLLRAAEYLKPHVEDHQQAMQDVISGVRQVQRPKKRYSFGRKVG